MSSNAARVGERIRAAREALGWSQGELARRVDRTQTAISYWESGRRALGIDDLIDLARVLNVPTAELLPDAPAKPVTPTLLRAVAEKVDAAKLADELERFTVAAQGLERPAIKWRVAPASPRDTAEALLEASGISKYPIPIQELAYGCGVQILSWDFHDIDGLIVELPTTPVIWVNPGQAEVRQRFTLAHELGHYLLRHIDRFHIDFGGDLSPSVTGGHPNYDWRAERAANEFAANILMPASLVRARHAVNNSTRVLAKEFQVSAAAMRYRLANLGLDSDTDLLSLF
ncbi:helix-turn-helix domain-containing protein [Microbispora bryophytorum]|uniref:helix-turn-helix domain-containing protein n=1 Tax=Microbispora bryophytorum TaxID=1460882 RepID=UPI00371A5791